MRADQRSDDALRPISITRNFTKHAEGSVLVAFGDTKVICTASISNTIPRWLKASGRGWVTAEYAMLPRSAQERINRDSVNKGRAQEISRLIGRSLRCVVDLDAMPERRIIVDCDVIQADGGTRTAAITGAYVALCDACRVLTAEESLPVSPIVGQCAAVSVGLVDGRVLLDLCYEEDFRADVDMNLVMLADGGIVEIQGCAEGAAFPRARMDEMMDVATTGINDLLAIQNEALGRG